MPDGAIEAEYPYRLPWWVIALWALMCGGLAAGFAYLAGTNDRAWVIRGVALDAHSANVVFGIAALLPGGFLALTPAMVAGRIRHPRRIVFTRDGVLIPRPGRGPREIRIPYDRIERLVIAKELSVYLHIDHAWGRTSVEASMVGGGAVLDEIERRLAERAGTFVVDGDSLRRPVR